MAAGLCHGVTFGGEFGAVKGRGSGKALPVLLDAFRNLFVKQTRQSLELVDLHGADLAAWTCP